MIVCQCGCESAADTRFCRDCGRALADQGTEVLELGSESAVSTDRVTKGGDASRFWLPLLAVVGVVGLAGLALSTVTSSSGDDDAAAEVVDDPDDPGDDEGDNDADDDDPADPATADDEASASSTTDGPNSSSATVVDLGEPVFGEQVAYDLVIPTSRRPSILHPNTGELEEIAVEPGTPVAVSGRWMLLQLNRGLVAFDLDDPEAEPRVISEPGQYVEVVNTGGVDDGLVWFIAFSEDAVEGELNLYDIETGERLRHPLDGDIDATWWWTGGVYLDIERTLFSASAGGVYEQNDDGFVLVSPGRLLVADATRALVEVCDGRFNCSVNWYDRDTWERLDLIVPEDRYLQTQFVHGTDWLATNDFRLEAGGRLLNIVTGQVVSDIEISEGWGSFTWAQSVSPDGLWLAVPSSDPESIEFIELTTAERRVVPIGQRVEGALLFRRR